MKRKAIVLLSGGLDSTTVLYYALSKGYECHALIFDYGQRHKKEVRHAVTVASRCGNRDKKRVRIPYHILKIKLPWKGSSLLNKKDKIPANRKMKGIPSTYVPARNSIFLSFALSYAEAIGAKAIFIGANAIDFSGYPDCRPSFYAAFQKMIEQGTKARGIKVVTPLINMTKAQIVKLGHKLGAPLEDTWSCYAGDKEPCGVCDSCRLRHKGFSLYNRGK